MTETLELAKQLINIPSVTPHDLGCQQIISDRLRAIGFSITTLPSKDVSNLWASYGNSDNPLFVFSGHTDVVSPGNEKEWRSPPFCAAIRDNKLFGRGAADMKSALAAMIIATERFLKTSPNPNGRIGFMITSDEEGDAINGTKQIIKHLTDRHIKIDWCLIGEASSNQRLGDVIKIGRRGSLHGALTVFGKQGHIAYPHQAINPIHRSFQALDVLTKIDWDSGNEYFTPTTFQIYNINADTGASNIIPGSLTARFNFRYSPASTADALMKKTQAVFDEHGLMYKINWNLASIPFLSHAGSLREACQTAIQSVCHLTTTPNTTGGTSDGRFIAQTGAEIVELGPCSQSIHQVDEHTDLGELETLTNLYEEILRQLLVAS